MSRKDLDRFQVLKQVLNGKIKQVEAARLLNITDRQVRRLIDRIRIDGPSGIVSRLIGKKGNRHKPPEVKQRVLALLREKYEGFGPTLASEKLIENEGIKISKETIRSWMLEHHLWITRKRKTQLHTTRLRRPCFGELIQGDGSADYWFGTDKPMANATVLIDDATSMITALHFSETETLEAYYSALQQHLEKYGRPQAIYTDRTLIFNSPKGTNKTQMQKALKELGIESILANSPQAKGRVERAHRTLQDRLKKEFHLRGIKTIEQANSYTQEFIKEYNEKFSKKPMSAYNAHRSLEGYDLEQILCRREERTLNCSAIFHFNNVQYQIQQVTEYRRLNKRKVEIRITRTGKMRVFLAGKEVKVLPLSEVMEQTNVLNRKQILTWKPKFHKPRRDHPWRRYSAKNRGVRV